MTPTQPTPRVMASLLRSLSHPSRLAILRALSEQPCYVGDLVTVTGASQPNTSQHLAVLRDLGLVRKHKEGPKRLYQLADPTTMTDFLRSMAQFVNASKFG